ncbi:hypothetical protein [Microbacterium dauci]|uniref:Septum formation-related domain-containing protein n=1 Tax=Microbacterium dauci TaxID=3048008 RepID=A0ABT6ZCK6_9MICO|nr:hypothetical protein [Microbacterium sp. LX3-4]MDJ1113868.1 hypothetical protein [Microbacterium sp. LX3-4]
MGFRTAGAVLLAATIGVTLLVGCASPAAEPAAAETPVASATRTPTPSPTPTPTQDPSPVLSEQTVAGIGSDDRVDLDEAPTGTQSVMVDFTCAEGDAFSVEYGDSMMLGQAPLQGECGAPQQLWVPLLPQSQPFLWVTVADGVEWEASVVASSNPFAQDAALVDECAGFADVFSQLQNADDGYGFYAAFGSSEWYERVDAATGDLAALVASAASELEPSLRAVLATLEERDRVPGAALEDVWDEFRTITTACDRNQSPVEITAEFGG